MAITIPIGSNGLLAICSITRTAFSVLSRPALNSSARSLIRLSTRALSAAGIEDFLTASSAPFLVRSAVQPFQLTAIQTPTASTTSSNAPMLRSRNP